MLSKTKLKHEFICLFVSLKNC